MLLRRRSEIEAVRDDCVTFNQHDFAAGDGEPGFSSGSDDARRCWAKAKVLLPKKSLWKANRRHFLPDIV
jgi:hypothetical protein